MSLFIAWMPQQEALTRLAVLRDGCRNADAAGWTGWRQNAQLHMTLRFLSHVPPEEPTGLDDVLARIAARHAPFEMKFDRIEPWASALVCRPGENPELKELLDVLNVAAMEAGYAEMQTQTPHVTLAYPPRDQEGRKRRLTSAPEPDARLLPVPVRFDRFAVVRTVPGGYQPLWHCELTGNA